MQEMALVSRDRRLRVLGVPVDAVGMSDTLAWVEHRISTREPGTHLCVNAANVVRAHDDPEYLALLERGDLIGCDGQPFVWAARMLGHPLPERVAGIDLMEEILKRARHTGWKIFLLGAKPHVVERLSARLRAEGVNIAGYRDGYFDRSEEPRILEQIRESGADVLFVGMPTPDKERFIIDGGCLTGVPVCIGVGGSFDVLAGELRRAPRALQRMGLEWLFRLVQEPRRLFRRYAVTNTKFVVLVLRAVLQRPRANRT
ncbi:N-acetylglucosaminyldiphosphoundecaprenol N-acetyl-beta-D-mannosaminyltransferase [Thermasporomyces composti]|uniref:N-acetylglucosaminyldiphosphoundecaprenol N-acetyl-beta-D-mannosaminyltransferase n=2 Tax=Thermasporomyces composti TaxID=696763 RepID=A0A3D9VE48_THECX|nr:N-acetylglucosaminyldiphosphoundecaprenol N-acetyl-beta-D-mannosaminyltransferase [Thermasporomyces composti]